MSKHVIVGAGTVGTAAARLLARRGDQVILLSRSGQGAEIPGVQRLKADATDVDVLRDATTGAAVVYNCANPAYNRWSKDWPPLAAALLSAAESSGAVLATISNLYGYGAVTAPMTEESPLRPNSVKGRVRTQMWLDAAAWHQAGRIRATEVRSADYIGGNSQSHLGARVVPRILAGKKVQVLGNPDTAHTWTYVEDVARLLVTVGGDERAWGKPWHVPSNAPRTQREAVADLARTAGVADVPVTTVPGAMLSVLGLFNPVIRELPEMAYQLKAPFVLDSSAAQATFDVRPTPWNDVLAATVEHYRSAATHS